MTWERSSLYTAFAFEVCDFFLLAADRSVWSFRTTKKNARPPSSTVFSRAESTFGDGAASAAAGRSGTVSRAVAVEATVARAAPARQGG
ncbi:hypothetical protein [Streptomyces sp. NPDC020362]|uniref:hypothetical protein n=1 Tax=unclassified Streptomyces TaxID=2593676 RepID=UPI0033D3F53A